jgi:O-antigen ligase
MEKEPPLVSLRLKLVDFGSRAWLDSPTAGRTAAAATAAALVLAAILPDAIANVGLLQTMTAMLAVLVVALALTVRWPRPGLTDIGLVLLLAASLWPRVAHLQPGAPGALLFIVATYGIGRLSGLTPRTLAVVLLGAGAIMGAIAIAQAVPVLSPLVPFQPMRYGLPFDYPRSTGLFDNPNVFGGYEAATVVVAAVVGLPIRLEATRAARARSAALFGAVTLCLVGLGLSASRESVLGLGAGLTLVALVPRRGLGERARSLVPYAISAGVAVGVVLAVTAIDRSGLPGRFNPISVTTDHNLLDRLDSWRLAVDLIRHQPLLGYGASIPMRAVDNAYLEWMLAGGVIGLAIWLAAVATVTPRAAWPIATTALTIGAFANPFAVGPTLAILMISCGALASQPASGYSATGKPRMLKPPST